MLSSLALTHWGRVTYICVSKLTTIGSDNGLSPGRRQAIIWTNYGILLIRTLGTNFSEILGEIHSFSFKKMHLKMSSAKRRLFCLGLNVLSLVGLCLPWGRIVITNSAYKGLKIHSRPSFHLLDNTNGFSIAIQIRWKFRFTLTSF